MTGGVALNCVANAKILEQTDVRRIWVPPCASDTGAPLGSALWHYHQTLGHPRGFRAEASLLRPGLQRHRRSSAALRAAGLRYRRLPEAQLLRRVAQDLADGKIVGWFQGRFEMGPRALGNRSILADPAPRRHARRAQRQGQEARAVPPVRAGRADRAGARVLRDRPARPVHDAGAARAPDKRQRHPGRRACRRHGPHPDRRAVRQPALLRADRGVRPLDRRTGAAQHQLQPQGADRRTPRGGDRLLPARAGWMCWCLATSTSRTAAPARPPQKRRETSANLQLPPRRRSAHARYRADHAPSPRIACDIWREPKRAAVASQAVDTGTRRRLPKSRRSTQQQQAASPWSS